ncbi:FliA/WhiG family RNA polymerase sigma factor [Conexibacter sp. CPCC 206217]|uniref:FliA/WhiG family RNA polymerase sigma factor n=1 Tax=Conexibacter sp. CPCC 206217 TaxID=3064574 RepID=UPI00271B1049|nr:FliA/WhiG family RNA polymerase sigma factor [Conexibacter sp. CPCC 206217]MDO8212263.1 FliA/WhiG family RNA polymerase sigma factor [Conexibacter sp. CPCC 206217]
MIEQRKPVVLSERWRHYKTSGDSGGRDELVLAYAPIVKYVVGRVASRLPAHVDSAELMSDGFVGLIDAVERFDPKRGVPFESFADRRIRGAILDGLRSMDWVPRAVREEARAISRATTELTARLHRAPTDDELARELTLSEEELEKSLQRVALSRMVALDEPMRFAHTDGSMTLVETLADPQADDPAEVAGGDDDRRERIAAAVKRLPERDQVILALHYHQDLPLAQIGEVLDLSESRVGVLHAKALLQLRAELS